MSATFPAPFRNIRSSARLLSLDRFVLRCSHQNCRHRGRLWPVWLRRADGVVFQGKWYCSSECAGEAIEREFLRLHQEFRPAKPRTHRIPLGLLLVTRGLISVDQLRAAIRLQSEAGQGKLGFWLRRAGAIGETDLTAALGMQWGCPVFPLDGQKGYLECGRLLPFPLLQEAQVLPVHFALESQLLYLAFVNRVDHSLLYAIERMLGCKTAPCVAAESAVAEAHDQIHPLNRTEETLFDSLHDPREMARTTCSYARKLQTASLQVVRAANYIWVRCEGGAARNLLFKIQSSPANAPFT